MALGLISRTLEKPFRFIFGDDIFISYSRDDGITYAEGLGSEFSQRGFSCRIDLWETSPGTEAPPKLRRWLRWSRMLVLLGTEKAAISVHVDREIEEFLKTGGVIVPIAFPKPIESAYWYPHVAGLPWAPETSSEALVTGHPSEAVVKRIETSATFTQRNRRIRRIFVTLLISSLTLVGVSALAVVQAKAARKEAAKQGDIAFSRQLANQAAVVGRGYDLSLLLAAKAYRVHPTFEARRALLELLLEQPHLSTMLRAGKSAVSSLAVSPDGRVLAAGIADGNVVFWSLPDLRQLNCPVAAESGKAVESLSFSIDSRMLASQDTSGRISLWNVATRRRVKDLDASGGGSEILATGVALTRSSRLFALGGFLGMGIWQVADPMNPRFLSYSGWPDIVGGLTMSPDGKRLAIVGESEIGVLDATSLKLVGQTFKIENFVSAAFSPHPGSTLLAIVSENRLFIWDYINGKHLETDEWGWPIAFSTDGQLLAVVGPDTGDIVLWDVPDPNQSYEYFGSSIELARYRHSVRSLTFAGRQLFSGHEDGTIAIWELPALHGVPRYTKSLNPPVWTRTARYLGEEIPLSPSHLAVSADGRAWAISLGIGSVVRWHGERRDVLLPVRAGRAEFSPDGRLLATYGKDFAIWDIAAQSALVRWGQATTLSKAHPLAFGSDGDRSTLVTRNDQGMVTIWDITTPLHPVPLINRYHGDLWCATYRRDGRALVTAGSEGVFLWDLTGSKPAFRDLGGHKQRIASLLFDRDGANVLGISNDSRIVVWDISHHPARVQILGIGLIDFSHAALSPDGTTLALVSGSSNYPDITLLEMDTYLPFSKLLVEHLQAVAFSPDSQKLLLLHHGSMTTLEIGSGLPSRACRKARRELTPEETSQYLGERPDPFFCPDRPPSPNCPGSS